MNKITKSSILPLVGCALGFLAMAFYAVTCVQTENYFVQVFVYLFTVAALALCVVDLLFLKQDTLCKDIVSVVLVLLYTAALLFFVVGSVDWIGHILSKDNVPPFTPMYAVAAGFYLVTVVVSIVESFSRKTELLK